jgi:fatty-acyl-CoA synthase
VVLRADERELLELARANLAHFKAPHSVTFVQELPKTATGKIQKHILRGQRPGIAPQGVRFKPIIGPRVSTLT